MSNTYAQNKEEVVLSIYRLIRESDGATWISAAELEPYCPHFLSRSFIHLILIELEKSSYVDGDEDETGEYVRFRLTGKGVLHAEKIVTSKQIWPEFDQIVTSVNETVDLSQNPEVVAEINETLEELEYALQSANDVGSMSADEVISARSEVAALKTYFQAAKVRAGIVAQQARQTLSWIIRKAGASGVTEISKRLVDLILSALGYGS